MFIKSYLHPNKLRSLRNKDAVLAKQMPNSQYEIEIFVDITKYEVSNQQNGVLVRKKSFLERLLKRK